MCLIGFDDLICVSFFNTGVDPAFHPSCVISVLTPWIDGLIQLRWNRTRPLISAIGAVSIQVSTVYLSGVLSDSCIYYVWVEILRPDTLVTAALWYRAGHYIFVLWFLQSFFVLLSSPILSRRILDVCHTSTHDVNLVKI